MSTSTPSSVKPIPEGMHTVTPHLVCADAAGCIEFYKKTFGATEVARMLTPEGKIMHAAVKIGDSTVFLVDEMPAWGSIGPKARGGSAVTIHLYVPDVDAFWDRAVKAGAVVKLPLQDMFWGDRYGQVEDPAGHIWSMATHKRDMTPAQMAEEMKKMCQ